MKPTSIISLIVAVVLIIAGLTTCIIAQNMANASGRPLFSTEDGRTDDLSDKGINKIELSASEATINIYGSSDQYRIELVNFNENYYTYTTANKTLSFKEIPDLLSMVKFWENGFSFKGIRHLLHFSDAPTGDKEINIYLPNDNSVNRIILNLDAGEVNLHSLSKNMDYSITLAAGTINVDKLTTTSNFTVNGNEVALRIGEADIGTFNIGDVNRPAMLDFSSEKLIITKKANIKASDGKVVFTTSLPLDRLNLDLFTAEGKLLLNGADLGTNDYKRVNDIDKGIFISVDTITADVVIRRSSLLSGNTDTYEPENTGNETANEETTSPVSP